MKKVSVNYIRGVYQLKSVYVKPEVLSQERLKINEAVAACSSIVSYYQYWDNRAGEGYRDWDSFWAAYTEHMASGSATTDKYCIAYEVHGVSRNQEGDAWIVFEDWNIDGVMDSNDLDADGNLTTTHDEITDGKEWMPLDLLDPGPNLQQS